MLLNHSTRARAIQMRSYCRPIDDVRLETWEEVVLRSHGDHQRYLWQQAGGTVNEQEIEELVQLGLSHRGLLAGRTLWMGGTEYGRSRAVANFNCSFRVARTVWDMVDIAWLLLNGCGVGFQPIVGTLHGFLRPVTDVVVVPSDRPASYRGREENIETRSTEDGLRVWKIQVGDSAIAWAKALGKLLNPPREAVDRLVLDFSEVRGPGARLKGYGWICNGYAPLAACMSNFVRILNLRSGQLLDEIDILDLVNHIGTILSSRRSAQICLLDITNPMAGAFASAKRDYYVCRSCGHWDTPNGKCSRCDSTDNNQHRRQSNNSLQAWSKPTRSRIEELIRHADEAGGDPGIENSEAMRLKMPWAIASNPCHEIGLADASVCNLTSLAVPLFRGDTAALERAAYVLARANYRQTCVSFNDGVLSPTWGQTNESLRLCGVSLTGIIQAPWLTPYRVRLLRNAAIAGAYSMADELRLPRPKATTTIKPEGTRSKVSGLVDLELAEGIHNALGRHIFNWVNFSRHDSLVGVLQEAGYRTLPSPSDSNNVLVCFPVQYSGCPFTRVDKGGGRVVEVNVEPAISQLDRYLWWNNNWADHMVSATISYSPEEIPEIVDWLDRNWDRGFIATAFLRRNDPTKTAKDLGHPYLPQEVVDAEAYHEYRSKLRQPDWSKVRPELDLVDVEDCPGGICPIR